MILIYFAFIIDYLIGDPEWFPHPVRGVGWLIKLWEKISVKLFGRNRFSGTVTGFLVIIITVLFVWGSIFFAKFAFKNPALQMSSISPFLAPLLPENSNIISVVVTVFWLWAGLSARSLAVAGMEIYSKLEKTDIKETRKALAMLVGRDTEDLDESGINRATIETVAENSVDGIISPLFFAIIGGAPLMWAFKAVNTCDSMIGYKNERYIRFGTFCAKLDDLLNYIPARISYHLYPTAAFLLGLSANKSYEIADRDAKIHASPNSGIPEAAVAGALQVSLGGPSTYDGKLIDKEFFGKEFPPPERKHIKISVKLMWMMTVLMLIFAGLVIYLAPVIYDWFIKRAQSGGGGG